MLDALEKKFRRLAIPNLTLYLIVGQAIFFLVLVSHKNLYPRMILFPQAVLDGQWWRLLTFAFMPPRMNVAWAAVELYMLYIMGSALETNWGAFRYNLYLLIGYLATLAVTFSVPGMIATNMYWLGSILLAFAVLYPDFQILLFFIIPMKAKWIALATWLLYGYSMVTGTTMVRMLILASVANYALFFGGDIIRKIRGTHRTIQRRSEAVREAERAFHRCSVCGKTDKSHPDMEFRYCPDCDGAPCYCMDHIHDHEHK